MSAPINTGGQAFPSGKVVISSAHAEPANPGMTLRDYFAAHAPEMPEWFQCKPPEPNPFGSKLKGELTIEQRHEYEAWHARYWQHAFLAWRWHYADMMVRGREAS